MEGVDGTRIRTFEDASTTQGTEHRVAHASMPLAPLGTDELHEIFRHLATGDIVALLNTSKAMRNMGGHYADVLLTWQRTIGQVKSDFCALDAAGQCALGGPPRSFDPFVHVPPVSAEEMEQALQAQVLEPVRRAEMEWRLWSAVPHMGLLTVAQSSGTLQPVCDLLATYGPALQSSLICYMGTSLLRNTQLSAGELAVALDMLLALEVPSPPVTLKRLEASVNWTASSLDEQNQQLLSEVLNQARGRSVGGRALVVGGLLALLDRFGAPTGLPNEAGPAMDLDDFAQRVRLHAQTQVALGGTVDAAPFVRLFRAMQSAVERTPYVPAERRMALFRELVDLASGPCRQPNVGDPCISVIRDMLTYEGTRFDEPQWRIEALDLLLGMDPMREVPQHMTEVDPDMGEPVSVAQLFALSWHERHCDENNVETIQRFLQQSLLRADRYVCYLAMDFVLPQFGHDAEMTDTVRARDIHSHRYFTAEMTMDLASEMECFHAPVYQVAIKQRLQERSNAAFLELGRLGPAG